MHYFTRISYNKSGWKNPTGDASKLELKKSFNSLHRFGFEDWLFRDEWQIDGWRYAFLQGANIKNPKYQKSPINVSIYTIDPDKQRRWVAEIADLECLASQQSHEAEQAFAERRWLQAMQEEVRAVGGDPDTILHTDYSGHFLNVRYRLENLRMMPMGTYWPRQIWQGRAAYYYFYPVDELMDQGLAALPVFARRGRHDPLPQGMIYRAGVGATSFMLAHRLMQAALLAKLQERYGREQVRIEVDGIDLIVDAGNELQLYEIKSDLSPRTVIRQALGQLLEYAYHPSRSHSLPLRLVIVGSCELGADEWVYLDHLKTAFNLPIEYVAVSV